jgi:phage shock protein E
MSLFGSIFGAATAGNKLSAADFMEKYNGNKSQSVVLDVRTPGEFAGGHLSIAKNSDFMGGKFASDMEKMDKSKTYFLYCASGNRSGQAARMMEQAGFENVYNVGGYGAVAHLNL